MFRGVWNWCRYRQKCQNTWNQAWKLIKCRRSYRGRILAYSVYRKRKKEIFHHDKGRRWPQFKEFPSEDAFHVILARGKQYCTGNYLKCSLRRKCVISEGSLSIANHSLIILWFWFPCVLYYLHNSRDRVNYFKHGIGNLKTQKCDMLEKPKIELLQKGF